MRKQAMRIGAALILVQAWVATTGGAAHAAPGEAFSMSAEVGAIPMSSFTNVAKRKLEPGIYAVTTTGVIRNSSTTNVAYVSCDLAGGPGVSGHSNLSEFVVPIALSPGVPGSATWSITTTVKVTQFAPAGGGLISVFCGSFGPATANEVTAWFPSIVAIQVSKDQHKTAPAP
jgi:hypothetical protein